MEDEAQWVTWKPVQQRKELVGSVQAWLRRSLMTPSREGALLTPELYSRGSVEGSTEIWGVMNSFLRRLIDVYFIYSNTHPVQGTVLWVLTDMSSCVTTTTFKIQNSHITQNTSSAPFHFGPSPPPALSTHASIFVSLLLPFPECHIDEARQCTGFCVWLLAPSTVPLNFICVGAGMSSFSLSLLSRLSLCSYAIVCLFTGQVMKDICF